MSDPTKGRDLSRAVTVVNRFTVKGDATRFERQFLEHADFLRHQPGFHRYVTARLTQRPVRYVHLGYWCHLEAFVDVVHHKTFAAHARRLSPMVETEADQAVSVVPAGGEPNLERVGEPGTLVLTDYVVPYAPAEFERRFLEQRGYLADRPGFGAVDLLRSTMRPHRYLGLTWWYDADLYGDELRLDGYRAHAVRLAELAESTTHPAQPISYQSSGC